MRLEIAHDPASVCFGAVHGQISAFEQYVGIFSVKRRDGNAHADADLHELSAQIKRLAKHCDNAPRQGCGTQRLGRTTLQHGKFITPQAGNQFRVAHAGAQPLRHLA